MSLFDKIKPELQVLQKDIFESLEKNFNIAKGKYGESTQRFETFKFYTWFIFLNFVISILARQNVELSRVQELVVYFYKKEKEELQEKINEEKL